MLGACKALLQIVQGKGGTNRSDEGAIDLILKRQGVQILKVCAMDEMPEIRITALQILKALTVRTDI